MPLEVLGLLVLFGVGGIVLLVHLMGWSRANALADEAEAMTALWADYPDVRARRAILGDDGCAALVEAEGGLGVVRAMGAGRLTRMLGPGDGEARERPDGIRIVMADFGAPGVDVLLADDARRTEALELARRALGEKA